MLRKLKDLTLQMVAGANTATVGLMLFTAYSDHIDAAEHPALAQAGLLFPVMLVMNLFFFAFWLMFSKRHALIPVAGYLLCCVPIRTYFPINIPRSAPEEAIKVLSYNVCGFRPVDGSPEWPNMTLEYIANSGADIVCLQDGAIEYGLEHRVDSVLRSIYAHSDTVHTHSGNCLRIYTTFPIVGREIIHYESRTNRSVAYRLLINGDTVTVINNHLESNGLTTDERQRFKDMVKGRMNGHEVGAESKTLLGRLAATTRRRAPEAEAVARYVSKNMGKSIILCGDFNDMPISYTHRTIARHLTDCYVATGNGPGISYHLGGFYVRIDNIMCSDDWVPYACKVDSRAKASDHYPIYCWLKRR